MASSCRIATWRNRGRLPLSTDSSPDCGDGGSNSRVGAGEGRVSGVSFRGAGNVNSAPAELVAASLWVRELKPNVCSMVFGMELWS